MTDKAELLERAETVETRLRARLDRLPDEKEAPNERLRDAVYAEALNGRSVAGSLRNLITNVRQPKKSLNLEPLEAWRDLLVGATTHFETQLAAFELLPEAEQRHRYTEISAVRFALRVIQNGDFSEEGESPLANEWLKQAGLKPEWGQVSPFSGRGGLRMVTRRIADVEKRLAVAREELTRLTVQAEAILETPELTVEGQEAVMA